jgi:DNA-binding response OmpR family regulator
MSKKALIVEDEGFMAEILKEELVSAGYEVVIAKDGQEGLDKARSENPNIIIMDLMLPKIDGFRLCKMLKFDGKYKHIPIIMLTARSQESDKALGQETGADFYMNKPYDPVVLLAKIEELLKNQKAA